MCSLGAQRMFAVTYAEFSLVAPKAGFDLALQVNVDVITPANAGTTLQSLSVLEEEPSGLRSHVWWSCDVYSVVH